MNNIKVIKSKPQYLAYNRQLRKLWEDPSPENEDERELLEVLIRVWEQEHLPHEDSDPIELLKFLMENHELDRSRMMEIMEVNKATLSKILNYKKGLSKNVIRRLSEHFNISQEAFNRPYLLQPDTDTSAPKAETV
ncbi:MAG: helix-turn-helix domain-containing protein [Flavobacteriales bacterium]